MLRLVDLVLRFIEFNRFATLSFSPEVFGFSHLVVADEMVRRVQDHGRGTVVLLHPDHTALRIIRFEVEDIPDVGSPPGIDRLVRVPDDRDLFAGGGQQPGKAILGMIRVLVFVDQDIPEPALPRLQDFGGAVIERHRLHNQIAEIARLEAAHFSS